MNVNDASFQQMCEDLKAIQKETNSMSWLMNQFLQNSFPNKTQKEAIELLKKLENGC